MALLVISYPEISDSDFQRIQKFRKDHDHFYRIVNPHFTLVFPVVDWQPESFIREIEKQVKDFQTFEFCVRCATLNKDAFNDYYHTFLVPDEGFSHFIKLHDVLYADLLFPQRALQIDFVPHIGIGNSRLPEECLEMISYWNRRPFEIHGRISVLDIINFEKNQVRTIQKISLKTND